MARVLVIGVAVADFVFQMETFPSDARKYRATNAEIVGGGCAANAAVAVARLGGEALLGARLGADHMGDIILSDLREEGVDTSLIQQTTDARSSFSSVYVDAKGERQIMNYRGADLSAETGWIENAPDIDAVLADTRWTEGAIAALDLARQRGIPGIVDAEAPMDAAVLGAASHVAFSRDGLMSFAPSSNLKTALRNAAKKLDAWVCVTDGENGVLFTGENEVAHLPAFAVDVKDTLGAGDIWHGAFALALGEGYADADAIRFANAAAAIKCTKFGGRHGTPKRAELEKFLRENSL
ncbi:MAG: PfkB family carbohydrate kinase [Boseongicola sp.]